MYKLIKHRICKLSRLIINTVKFKTPSSKIKRLYHIHNNSRCFIIGNGPSLRVEDLEKLNNEISFGTHRIYDIFDNTEWRPTYYCAQDTELICKSSKEINRMDIKNKFIAVNKFQKYPKIKKSIYINLFLNEFYPELPEFSKDITKGIFEGYTVSYMCLQIAMYMGFKEIYLLGIDHNYSVTLKPNGELEINDQLKDHFSEKDKLANIPQLYKSTLAYESAKKYAEANGIKIFNATRGGKLETFERVNFDEIFLKTGGLS